jgi:RNA polymerase sigma-70 factor (ECF subfamily)
MVRRATSGSRGELFAPPDWYGAGWDGVPLPDDPDGARLAAEDEARFIERLVARDELAFTTLMEAYQARVFTLLLRMLNNRAEAEELVQDVFFQVFKAIGTFRGESKLSTWIYRIAINLCKNRMKYRAVRQEGKQDDIDAMSERLGGGDGRPGPGGALARPDEMMQGKQLEAIVRDAIQTLEPGFRECLVLRDVEDLSYEEIEAITGLPAGTVKSRIHRARAQLKELVEKALGERIE